ncbi:MAG: 1-(5-phosphoribosyl)-5-[(5-phosphoribosylamino)methylideneamino]imidazole-4-carboxamide isomerase [Armatimonadota bacterium]|nr:1-(5-phosphoribosyl)-5-[(5-phosphoribosylamino)methylideneamino]imidazole-4-carboxamide isomerase [Armatimonadota bacterium]
MLIIPAIDILGGRCVRLRRGDPSTAVVYEEDPAVVAVKWERAGARWLHVVDLDGAFRGVPHNLEAVGRILQSVRIPVQFGGGIRNRAALEQVFDVGVSRAILGTKALADPDFLSEATRQFQDRIAVALDVKSRRVAVEGWLTTLPLDFLEAAKILVESGVRRLIYTDVSRDGAMTGPDLSGLTSLLDTVGVPVIASGGVSSMSDLEQLAQLAPKGLEGVIIGRALYEGRIDLAGAIARFL